MLKRDKELYGGAPTDGTLWRSLAHDEVARSPEAVFPRYLAGLAKRG